MRRRSFDGVLQHESFRFIREQHIGNNSTFESPEFMLARAAASTQAVPAQNSNVSKAAQVDLHFLSGSRSHRRRDHHARHPGAGHSDDPFRIEYSFDRVFVGCGSNEVDRSAWQAVAHLDQSMLEANDRTPKREVKVFDQKKTCSCRMPFDRAIG